MSDGVTYDNLNNFQLADPRYQQLKDLGIEWYSRHNFGTQYDRAMEFADVGREGIESQILQQSGLTKDQLTPELQAQLNKLLDMRQGGATTSYDDAFKGFQATAPVVATQVNAANQVAESFQPFRQAGLSALDQQMALLGLSGQDAMNQAYNENPAQQFAREQAEQAMIRNRAVTGGLGDEGVQRELAYLTSGLTNQNIQQQLQQLGLLSGRGQQATGSIGDSTMFGAEATAGGIADANDIARMNKEQRAIRNAQNSGFNKVLGGLGMASNVLSLGSSLIPGIGAGMNFLSGLGGGAPSTGVTAGMPSVGSNISRNLYGYP